MMLDDAYKSVDDLKPLLFSARLISTPINKMYDESYLDVVWFGDDFKTLTIEKMIKKLKKINWEIEAEDYEL